MRTFSIVASSVALSSAQSNDDMAPVAPVAPGTKDHSDLITVTAAGGGALATHLAINAVINREPGNKDAVIDEFFDKFKVSESEYRVNVPKNQFYLSPELAEKMAKKLNDKSTVAKEVKEINALVDKPAKSVKYVINIPESFAVLLKHHLRGSSAGKIGAAIAAGAVLAGTTAHFIQKKNAGQ